MFAGTRRRGILIGMTDTDLLVTMLCALTIAVGVVGVVIPIIPGLALCWGAVLVWALVVDRGGGKWVVFGIVTVIALLATIIKYVVPGQRLKRVGIPTRTLVAGALLGLIGFFVIPVVGLLIGFILGIYLAERARLGDGGQAWVSTKHALRAVGLSIVIELFAGLFIAAIWGVGLLVT